MTRKRDQEFTFISITGKRYRSSFAEAVRTLYFHKQFAYGVLYTYAFLVFFMPQNYIFNFGIFERLFIWAALYLCYHVIWIVCFAFASLWATRTKRAFFTPINLLIACAIITLSFYQLAPVLIEIEQPSIARLLVEIGFNTILISYLEAVYYRVSMPIEDKRRMDAQNFHEWERL